jgi:hypothetical protein
MNFRPELAEKVMAGEKTVTRRLANDNPNSPWWRGACALKIGRDYAVCPGRGKNAIGRVRIVNVGQRELHRLTPREAHREGFESTEAFEAAWTAINGAYDPHALVWRVEFEAIR